MAFNMLIIVVMFGYVLYFIVCLTLQKRIEKLEKDIEDIKRKKEQNNE